MSKRKLQDAVDDIGQDRYVPTETTEVVPVTSLNGRLVPKHGDTLREAFTNIDTSSLKGKALVFAAQSPGDIEFDERGMAFIEATNYCIFADTGLSAETGEVTVFARTVLYDKEGRTYRTTSENAPHRLAAACDMFGPEVWARGIPFTIRERKSRKTGRVYHDMRIAWPDESEVSDDGQA